MFFPIFLLSLLFNFGQNVVKSSLVNTFGAPIVFHAAACEASAEIVKISSCTPDTENDCEEVEVPSQKLEYVVNCKNVTSTYCTNDLATINTETAQDAADESFAPMIPLLGYTCVETLQEHCYQEPKVTEVMTKVSRCLVIN